MPAPKAIIFDIGGVVVASPFQAILQFEQTHSIPKGYINLCISHSKPDGYWHRLERGEIELGEKFFEGFRKDLLIPEIWEGCWARDRQPRQGSSSDVKGKAKNVGPANPPLPEIDSKELFWAMMNQSQYPDQKILPALRLLRQSKKYIIVALSNTILFPSAHPFSKTVNIAKEFDIYISSAHVGFRKPDPRIFELAVEATSDYARRNAGRYRENGWEDGVTPPECVFLDDIGENVKAARGVGLRTIKVVLGKTLDTVKQLEDITGLDLRTGNTSALAKL